MARDHSRFLTAIHDDPDWRKLDVAAQHAYWMITTHPDLSYCGVIDYIPSRWLSFADGLTAAKIKGAVRSLERARYVVVDRGTSELLIRSFIRHDKILAKRNMGHACGRALGNVHSDTIRDAVLHELARLWVDSPELAGFAGFNDYDPMAYAMACDMARAMASGEV